MSGSSSPRHGKKSSPGPARKASGFKSPKPNPTKNEGRDFSIDLSGRFERRAEIAAALLLRGFSVQLPSLSLHGLRPGGLVANGCPLDVLDVGYYVPPNCGANNRVRLGWVRQVDEAPVDAWIVRGPRAHERCVIGRKSQLEWEIVEEKSWTTGNPEQIYMVPSTCLIEWEDFLKRLAARRGGLRRLDESLSVEEILAKAHSTDLALAAVDPTTLRELLLPIREELFKRLAWIERDLGGKVARGDPWV